MPEDFNPLAKAEELAGALRPIGLYEDRSMWISDGQPPPGIEYMDPEEAAQMQQPTKKILVMDLLIGDLAFSKRVQNPEQLDIDAEFSALMGGLNTAEVDDTRNEIIRKLEQGLNPFEED